MPNIAAMLVDLVIRADEVAAVHAPSDHRDSSLFTPDSRLAWVRLGLALAIASIGGVGMWSVVVVMSGVQAEFGASRGAVSLAFTLTMLGFGLGGVATGKITDRFGIVTAIALSIVFLGSAYVAAGLSSTLWQFIAVYFERYRGLAVTIVASGNYIAGTIWPPLVNWGVQSVGWRTTHIVIGLFCAATMTLLLLLLRAQIGGEKVRDHDDAPPPQVDLKLSTNTLTTLLCFASVSCCVAMAMPQVHIVAYCGDLGYGVARGAEMLSLMMAFGIVSRIGSGYLADKIGGLRTLLIGSVAQGFALLFYVFFDSLSSLFIISAMFGLFQGGIVPSYAIIVRESMPAREAATRVGIVILASVAGMSLGGWLSGVIFDATGSYAAAFINGLAWNALNVTIVVALLIRARSRLAMA